jgi:hypothetical protein
MKESAARRREREEWEGGREGGRKGSSGEGREGGKEGRLLRTVVQCGLEGGCRSEPC